MSENPAGRTNFFSPIIWIRLGLDECRDVQFHTETRNASTLREGEASVPYTFIIQIDIYRYVKKD